MSDNIKETDVNPATKQAGDIQRTGGGQFAPGQSGNPSGYGGFGDNPENRSNGSWKKADTPRAKLEKLLSETTVGEFMTQITESNRDVNLEEKLGDVLISGRLNNAFVADPDGNGALKVVSKELDSLLYFVYGSKSELDANLKSEDGIPLIRGFILPTAPEDFIDKDIREQLPQQQQKDQ